MPPAGVTVDVVWQGVGNSPNLTVIKSKPDVCSLAIMIEGRPQPADAVFE